MAIRIIWNKYETALLIDAYLKVENKVLSRNDAIYELSNILRKRAQDAGIEIDNIFRNENGIALQMSQMQYLMTDGKKGLKKLSMSKLFCEMVELYRTNRLEFDKILAEAKGVVDIEDTIRNQFLAWLSTVVSPMQFLEICATYPKIESLCLKIGILKKPLFETIDIKTILSVKHNVDLNKVFYFTYKKEISKMSLAIRYYYQWARDNKSIFEKKEYYIKHDEVMVYKQEPKEAQITKDVGLVDLSLYKEMLAEKYQKGFRIDSALEMKRLKNLWQKKYGSVLDDGDEDIRKHIRSITIQYNDLVYLPETMLDADTKQKLVSYIINSFTEGKKAIYYEALYKEFIIAFQGKRINNAEMMKIYLSCINRGDYVIKKNHLAADINVEINPIDEVREHLVAYGAPIRTDDLVKEFSNIPTDKIKWIIAGHNSAEFIRNKRGEYFHADIVDFTPAEIDSIIDLIRHEIDKKDFVGGSEIVEMISIKYPAFAERYPYLSELGMRDVLGYKLREVFSFKGKIISAIGQELSMFDVFANYAKSHEYFTLQDLNALKIELDTPIYFDAIYQNSLRISKDEFVSKEKVSFDNKVIDAAIDRFCTKEYISISEISHFGSFPDVAFPWNSFFLEHYISDYSEKYKLMHSGFNASVPVGAIVKLPSCKYQSFNELITSILVDSTIQLDREEALQYLRDNGFLARKSYADIETVLLQARTQRLQKG